EETRNADVPSLLLQPLVENAIRHGIAARPGPGEVTVRARRAGGRLRLEILDTGPGFRENDPTHGGGVGLGNTRARLEQLYGHAHKLERANRQGGGARVTVEIPLKTTTPPSEATRSA